MLDLAGHGFYALIFLGQVLLWSKHREGWLIRAIGTGGWVVIGLLMGMTSIWIWGLVFICLDLTGYRRWGPHHFARPRKRKLSEDEEWFAEFIKAAKGEKKPSC